MEVTAVAADQAVLVVEPRYCQAAVVAVAADHLGLAWGLVVEVPGQVVGMEEALVVVTGVPAGHEHLMLGVAVW